MSYGIMPYRFFSFSVAEWYGKNNPNITGQVLSAFKSRCESLDENFPKEEGWKSCEEILDEYNAGTFPQSGENTAKHWYMYEILIQYFNGVLMDNSEWYPCRNPPFYKFDEFKMYLADEDNIIKLGGPDDFPAVFLISSPDFEKALEKVNSENTFDEAQKKQFESWIIEARTNMEELILFYY